MSPRATLHTTVRQSRRGSVGNYLEPVGTADRVSVFSPCRSGRIHAPRRDEHTYPADDDGIFDGGNHDRSKVSKYDNLSDNGNGYEQLIQKPPQNASARAQNLIRSPVF